MKSDYVKLWRKLRRHIKDNFDQIKYHIRGLETLEDEWINYTTALTGLTDGDP